MAVVLTVHVIEMVWTRRREGGLVAPYLVIDHNGQQQQTEVARAGTTTTAWNQKALFPYAPTSDLVVMAFDAGRHGGLFLGQAVTDIAAMLQESQLHSITPIRNSTGAVIGHVAIEVELATSSKALAALMDIPCLKLSTAGSKISSKSSFAVTSQASCAFQDDHLSLCSSPFAVPDVQTGHIQQHLPQQSKVMQSASGSPTKLTHKLGALGHFLGLSTPKPRVSECGSSSPANPATPISVVPTSTRTSAGSWIDLAGGTGPMLTRRSMMRLSRSRSSCSDPSAPVMTASITTAHALALQHSHGMAAGTAGVAAAGTACAATRNLAAAASVAAQLVDDSGMSTVSPGSPMTAELRQSHASAANSAASSSCGSKQSDPLNCDGPARLTHEAGLIAAASTDQPSSPGTSQPSRERQAPQLTVLVATPKAAEAPLSPLRSNRLKLRLTPRQLPLSHQQQRLQQQCQLEKDLERLQQLALQDRAVHPALRHGANMNSHSAGGSDDTSSNSTGADDHLLHDFNTADASGKEKILYRRLIEQQVEHKAGSAQLLKLLVAQQQQQAKHDTQLLATVASISPDSSPRHHLRSHSPGPQHYPEVPVPLSFPGKQQTASAFDSRNGHAVSRVDSSSDGSNYNSSSKIKYYPEVPAGGIPATGAGDHHKATAGKGLPRAATAAGKKTVEERSTQSEAWQSCESGSGAVTPTSAVSHSADGSQGSQAPTDPGQGRSTTRCKQAPEKHSRLQQTVGGVVNKHGGVRRSTVSDGGAQSMWELGAEGSTPMLSRLDQHPVNVQPAYRCIRSAVGKPGYLYMENKATDVKKAARWHEYPMLEAVPYPVHAEIYPVHAVVIEPSAPPQ